MAKAEISWRRVTPEGEKLQVYAQRVGGNWRFFARGKRYDCWQSVPEPPLEDWLELLDGVKRRIQRKLARPEEETRVREAIRSRYPDASIE